MRDNFPNMLRAAAKEWRKENKFVATGSTRYDAALEEAADAIEDLSKQREYWELEASAQETDKNYLIDENRKLVEAWHNALDLHNRWIPVSELLPEAGERVLCYCRANIYEVMKMRTDGDWVYDVHHIYMHSFVTHWMPLPQPPKEET